MSPQQECFVIRSAPGKGVGMFATRDIKRGECVLSEKPLVYTYRNLVRTQMAIDAMSDADKEAFYALHNIHTDCSTALGIARTNALPLGSDAVDCAVYKTLSRINHSCVPNVNHTWNSKFKKEYIHATQDIAEGSEIFTSYLAAYMVREERMSYLQKNFKFECQCSLCVQPSPEYDTAVRRIKIYKDLIPQVASSNPKQSIQYVREILTLLDTIGGEGKPPFYYDGYQISAMYGDYKFAQEWADLLLESYVMEQGKDGSEYDRYLGYKKNPRSHARAGCARRQILS